VFEVKVLKESCGLIVGSQVL